MFRSWGVVMQLTSEVWVGGVRALVVAGYGSRVGWSAMAGGCWSVSGIVGEVVTGSEDTVGVGGSVLGFWGVVMGLRGKAWIWSGSIVRTGCGVGIGWSMFCAIVGGGVVMADGKLWFRDEDQVGD